jgi:hypothetical protein
MTSISPICKKCKNFISALKSPTYIDFMIKKIIIIQDIKISHLGTFNINEYAIVKRLPSLSPKNSSQLLQSPFVFAGWVLNVDPRCPSCPKLKRMRVLAEARSPHNTNVLLNLIVSCMLEKHIIGDFSRFF